jgi:uncharacterized tellurite resistance protein B-like protein
MLRALTGFFDQTFGTADAGKPASREHELQLATAVLLVEVARADFAEDEIELDAVSALLTNHLGIRKHEAERLVADARGRADHAASLQAFTRQLHEELGTAEKLKIVEMLWRVALADKTLDKHEDHLIRKVAGLLYVSHSDLLKIRNRVAEEPD